MAPQRSWSARWLRSAVLLVVALAIVWPIAHRFYRRLTPLDSRTVYETALSDLARGNVGKTQLAVELLSAEQGVESYRRVLEGALDLRVGRLQQAATRLIPALDDPATSAIALTLTGEAFYKNRQFAEAIEVLKRAVKIDDGLVNAHRWLAAAYYDIGTTGPTMEELTRVSEMAPDDPRPHRLMGLIYKDMESYEEAIPQYREALKRSSDFGDRIAVLQELAACLVEMGRFAELDEVLKQCPLNATVSVYAAQSLAAQGDPDTALQKLDMALALAPENLPALLLKGQLLLERSNVEEAVQALEQAVKHHPRDNGAQYQLSQLYARQGKPELAKQHSEEAIRLRELRSHFAELHAQASGDASSADLRYQLGVTAQQLGRPDMAATWFSAALALDPHHVQAAAELQSMATSPQLSQPSSNEEDDAK